MSLPTPIEQWLLIHEEYDIRIGRYIATGGGWRASLCHCDDSDRNEENAGGVETFTATASTVTEAILKVADWCATQLPVKP